jgi:dipeptidyl aminopeptidase/acylaminoacyl peptidase
LALTPPPAVAQRAMTPVDLLEVPLVGGARLSPDGESALYTLAEANWDENKRVTHIWRLHVESGESRQMTSGENGESSPRWSPDGRWIAFLAKRGDDEVAQIHLLATRGGEAEKLTTHPTAVTRIEWSPDSAEIFFLARDDKSEEEKKREERKDDVFSFGENWRHQHLWKVDLEGRETARVTEGDYSISSYRLSHDGSRIAHHRAPTPLIDDLDDADVWVMDADGAGALRLTDNSLPEAGAELSPDGSTVLFLSASDGSEYYFNNNVFLVPAAGGEPRLLVEDSPIEIVAARWGPGGSIVALGNTGVRSQLFRIDPVGDEMVALTEGDHSLRSWHYDSDLDLHLYSRSDPRDPGELWLLAGDDTTPRQVSHVYAELLEQFRLPRVELLSWKGADGVEVEGLLSYPLDYEPGRRYPLVVQTHGGPRSSDKFSFGRWVSYPQVLTARGWAVLRPNYRGSTGYGDEFLRDMVGHYFRNAHLDVLAGVDHLVELGIADPDRLVKMGWSGGGHMTNKIITVTDRFKAASSGAGAANWVSMYSQSDTRIQRTPWFGGSPWQQGTDIELWWRQSPLSEIWRVTTPTLVLVGANDERVPPPQSIELFRGLRANDVPSKLWMAPREGHGWRELRHELFKINVELEWFEKWALGREYEWAIAPGDEDEEDGDEAEVGAEATAGGVGGDAGAR